MPLWGNQINGTGRYKQENFHSIILAVLDILIPIMIFPKPFLDYRKYKRKKDERLLQEVHINNNVNNEKNLNDDDIRRSLNEVNYFSQVYAKEYESDKSFMDFFINQIFFLSNLF